MTTLMDSNLTAEAVNPLMAATAEVFEMMIGCKPTRTGLFLKEPSPLTYEVSAAIGITGRANGLVVLSLSKQAAIGVYMGMLGIAAQRIDAAVLDAVGELTNMVVGMAKARMASLELSISIPNMVHGREHTIHFPSSVQPICITFDAPVGPFAIEAGFTANQPKDPVR